MKLLRLGDTVINLDLVTDFRLEEDKIFVFLAAPITAGRGGEWAYQGAGSGIGTRSIVIEGGYATSLRVWIERHAEDVIEGPPSTEIGPNPFKLK